MVSQSIKRRCGAVGILVTLSLASVASADSVTYGLTRFTANGSSNPESQLTVSVRDFNYLGQQLTGQASFMFRNVGALASSITETYFEDGTLFGIATVNESSGVEYSQGGSPKNVPAGNTLSQPFTATQNFLATADSGNGGQQAHGVNNTLDDSEWVEVIFDLIDGQTYDDVIAAIQAGFSWTENGGPKPASSLRIAIHVTGLGDGESDSFLMGPQNIPLPAPVALGFAGLLAAGYASRRRRLS